MGKKTLFVQLLICLINVLSVTLIISYFEDIKMRTWIIAVIAPTLSILAILYPSLLSKNKIKSNTEKVKKLQNFYLSQSNNYALSEARRAKFREAYESAVNIEGYIVKGSIDFDILEQMIKNLDD